MMMRRHCGDRGNAMTDLLGSQTLERRFREVRDADAGLDADGRIVVARSQLHEGDGLRVHKQITIQRDGPRLWVTRFDTTIGREVPLELWTYPPRSRLMPRR